MLTIDARGFACRLVGTGYFMGQPDIVTRLDYYDGFLDGF